MQFIIRDDGVDEIIIDIPGIKKKIVEHYVIDFKQWIKEGPVFFVANKSEAREKALAEESISILRAAQIPIPEGTRAICEARLAMPGYKNRKERDAEEAGLRAQQIAEAIAQTEAETIALQQQRQVDLQVAVAEAIKNLQ